MDTALDMSLDDIIKSKKSAGGGRGRGSAPRGRGARGGSFSGGRMSGGGRGRGRGSGRQAPLGVIRSSSSTIAKTSRRTKNIPWQRNLLEESLAAVGLPGMESGTKLFISNLDSGVSNNDIRELFAEIGELKRYAIHFDKSGRPSGSAEVVYAKRSDAYAAHKRYNNVQLDGRPMKIEVVIPNAEVPVSAHMNVVGGTNGQGTRRVVMAARQSGSRPIAVVPTSRGIGQRIRAGFVNGRGRGRGMGRGQGQQRGRGRGRGKKQEKSVEELDKELEKYHAQGMNVD
ncbi:THO complex subunit 4C-like [Silene latifolia]|uniref:THO complex subunit 4C-like n=1 Tax=Silene latifolia TaxID=37657 RepID=UPI003D77AB63